MCCWEQGSIFAEWREWKTIIVRCGPIQAKWISFICLKIYAAIFIADCLLWGVGLNKKWYPLSLLKSWLMWLQCHNPTLSPNEIFLRSPAYLVSTVIQYTLDRSNFSWFISTKLLSHQLSSYSTQPLVSPDLGSIYHVFMCNTYYYHNSSTII